MPVLTLQKVNRFRYWIQLYICYSFILYIRYVQIIWTITKCISSTGPYMPFLVLTTRLCLHSSFILPPSNPNIPISIRWDLYLFLMKATNLPLKAIINPYTRSMHTGRGLITWQPITAGRAILSWAPDPHTELSLCLARPSGSWEDGSPIHTPKQNGNSRP